MKIILASASPRRREILENLGLKFEVVVSNADESCEIRDAGKLVCELSVRKALATQKKLYDQDNFSEDILIIGCDSVVVLGGEILGKPNDRQHAYSMLKALSGNTHRVISGLTLLYKGRMYTDFEETSVSFDTLSEDKIKSYVASGECDDKAGGYAIQGFMGGYITKIHGNYHNVVGLPLAKLNKLLRNIKAI